MLGGSIGGIPLLWIAMAASARNRKQETMKFKDIGLGDFIIDPVSKQWCRVVKIMCIWKDPNDSKAKLKWTPSNQGRNKWVYKNNRALPEGERVYEENLRSIQSSRHHSMRKMDDFWVTHELELEFADGEIATRDANKNQSLVCIHAPEIFSFNFEQLKSLTGNSKRGLKKKAKKKASKRKATKKKAAE